MYPSLSFYLFNVLQQLLSSHAQKTHGKYETKIIIYYTSLGASIAFRQFQLSSI